MSYPTPFNESNALLAVLAEDEAKAEDILCQFLPGELRRLEAACCQLADLCASRRREVAGN